MSKFHEKRDGGKVVPLAVVTAYIFDQHEHRENGVAVVESVALEKFLLGAAREETRAEKIADALDAQLETLKGNLATVEKNTKTFAAEGNWLQVGHYMKLADSYRSAIDELEAVQEKGDPVE